MPISLWLWLWLWLWQKNKVQCPSFRLEHFWFLLDWPDSRNFQLNSLENKTKENKKINYYIEYLWINQLLMQFHSCLNIFNNRSFTKKKLSIAIYDKLKFFFLFRTKITEINKGECKTETVSSSDGELF